MTCDSVLPLKQCLRRPLSSVSIHSAAPFPLRQLISNTRLAYAAPEGAGRHRCLVRRPIADRCQDFRSNEPFEPLGLRIEPGLISELGTLRYPAVDFTQRLERELKAVVDGLLTAVAAGDMTKIAQVNPSAEDFR
jgi:hypothetical protein